MDGASGFPTQGALGQPGLASPQARRLAEEDNGPVGLDHPEGDRDPRGWTLDAGMLVLSAPESRCPLSVSAPQAPHRFLGCVGEVCDHRRTPDPGRPFGTTELSAPLPAADDADTPGRPDRYSQAPLTPTVTFNEPGSPAASCMIRTFPLTSTSSN